MQHQTDALIVKECSQTEQLKMAVWYALTMAGLLLPKANASTFLLQGPEFHHHLKPT